MKVVDSRLTLAFVAFACSAPVDLRTSPLSPGARVRSSVSFNLDAPNARTRGVTFALSLRGIHTYELKVVAVEAGSPTRVEETILTCSDTWAVTFDGNTTREPHVCGLQGKVVNAWVDGGVWRRELRDGQPAPEDMDLLDTIRHPLSWEILPPQPTKPGSTRELTPLEITGVLDESLLSRTTGKLDLKLDEIKAELANLSGTLDAKVVNSGGAEFGFKGKVTASTKVGTGLARISIDAKLDAQGFESLDIRSGEFVKIAFSDAEYHELREYSRLQ